MAGWCWASRGLQLRTSSSMHACCHSSAAAAAATTAAAAAAAPAAAATDSATTARSMMNVCNVDAANGGNNMFVTAAQKWRSRPVAGYIQAASGTALRTADIRLGAHPCRDCPLIAASLVLNERHPQPAPMVHVSGADEGKARQRAQAGVSASVPGISAQHAGRPAASHSLHLKRAPRPLLHSRC